MSDAKDRLRLWLRLLKLTRRTEAELRDRLRSDFATTLPRFDVMAALSQHEDGLKMSHLSAVLRVSNGNVTGIVDRLVDEGFVERRPVAGDRRAMIVRLTKSGRDEFARQAAAHEGWIDALLQDIPAEEARQLSARLAHLTQDKESADAV
ncbi:MarR family transcriptional regulator [Aliishimia ponticola]|uniref:MarR family transcriptional regulator n=1 Tax=Aliishimia ponticola TaxID=2499833 RepID=A0A4S4NIL9_9RHOB|nr:MarR family transcriptional regulator [Aliishimia ponticola]THH38051.1 MarR family transcriptional regulator [Aliishimia ponticola]